MPDYHEGWGIMIRILLRRLGAMGDVVNTTPIARRLRAENPHAYIMMETYHSYVYWKNADVDCIVQPHIEEDGFDLIIDLNRAYERDRKRHQIDAMMRAAFGDSKGDKSVSLFREKNSKLDLDWSRTVVLHPNVNSWPQRTLPRDWWQEVANELSNRGWQVVVTGTMVDHKLDDVTDLRGILPLAEQASLIESSRAALCGPAGMSTVVGATDTPLIVLCNITRAEFGSLPYRHGELGWNTTAVKTPLSCYGCAESEGDCEFHPCARGDNACIYSFDVPEVVAAVELAMENDRRGELAHA